MGVWLLLEHFRSSNNEPPFHKHDILCWKIDFHNPGGIIDQQYSNKRFVDFTKMFQKVDIKERDQNHNFAHRRRPLSITIRAKGLAS